MPLNKATGKTKTCFIVEGIEPYEGGFILKVFLNEEKACLFVKKLEGLRSRYDKAVNKYCEKGDYEKEMPEEPKDNYSDYVVTAYEIS